MTARQRANPGPSLQRALRRASSTWLTAAPASSFIGRAVELDAIDRAFASGAQLVTVVGPPGIGKTRLATIYAQTREEAQVPGGTWFCDLTLATDATQAGAIVCATLGVLAGTPATGGTTSETVGDALADRGAMLLVLDNFEQLVESSREVARWCESAPLLRVLVTSRERLRLPGEAVVELGPLSLPEKDAAPKEILASEAARLFADRARGTGAGDPTRTGDSGEGGDAEAIAALVRALDGIPLAIELAAARARTLTPADMLARLTQRFDVLKARLRDGLERHATLGRAIDWSWDLLTAREQSALAQCSVFAGGFSLVAAEGVLDLGEPRDASVMETLEALCDKSLVTARAAGSSRRFGLYVSIRDYAASKLGAEETLRTAERHASYYLGEAARWAEAVRLEADPAARAALLTEQENVMAVYQRASAAPTTRESAEQAIRAVLALYPALENHGPPDELLSMLDRAVDLAETPGVSPILRARALCNRGNTYGIRGKVGESIHDLDRAIELAGVAGDDATLGEALVWISVRYRNVGRFVEAIDACDRAHALLEGAGRTRMVALNLAVRGRMRGELGQRSESREDNERAMAIFREIADRWYEGLTLANIAQLDMEAGDLEQARRYYEQALAAFREVGDRRFESVYIGYLGCLDWEAGALMSARDRLEAAVALAEEARTLNYAPFFGAVLGAVLAELGEVGGSHAKFAQTEGALARSGVPAFVAAARAHRGHVDLARARQAVSRGDAQEAARLRAVARARATAARRATRDGSDADGAPLFECSDDVRFAVRMLERALDAFAEREGRSAALVVGVEARWFSIGGARIDLQRRGAIRLILLALVRERVERPGIALRQEALLRAGWPGERVQPEAGSKRVRVAVSTLRRLGLEAALVTRDDGYLIGESVAVRVE
jgi:predicted ATPase